MQARRVLDEHRVRPGTLSGIAGFDPSAGPLGGTVREAMGTATRNVLHANLESRITFKAWSERVPEAKTGPLNWHRFPFQVELYDQGAEDAEAAIKKATQVGVSAFLLRWVLYFADVGGYTALYVFPKRKQMYDFCCAVGQQVLMADGTLRPIEDIIEGDRVLTADEEGRIRVDYVTAAWSAGERAVLRVRLAGGRELRVTPQHRVYTRAGWVQAGELREGVEVAVPRTLPEAEGASDLGADDAFLLALWLAEGSKTRAGFTFTNALPEVRERASAIAARRGWDVYIGERYSVALTARWEKGDHTPAAFLRQYGLRGLRTDTIRVPAEVMRAPRGIGEEFLRTYIACDGCVGEREVTVTSASERFIRDLQVLAARLEIPATVRNQQPYCEGKPGMLSWTLAIAERSARYRIAEMGVPGKLEPAFGGARSLVPGERDARVGWAKVRSVVDDGVAETFDLSTQTYHSFLLEGALTHNSDARVNTVVAKSPHLRARVRDHVPGGRPVDNKGLKRVGDGWVYFRGSESEDDLDSVDADVLALDEYNRLVPANIPVAERRTSGVDALNLKRRVGIPTIPGAGIDHVLARSDQRRWFVRCESCAERQYLTWADNVVIEDELLLKGRRVCRACTKPLSPDAIRGGEWVAEFPDRDVRGYHIPKLIVPELDLGPLIENSLKTLPEDVQAFWNRDLAESYADPEGRLTPDTIAAATSRGAGAGASAKGETTPSPHNVRTAGVDVASTRDLNVRISEWLTLEKGGEKRCIYLGTCKDFDELAKLFQRFDIHMAAIDHLPDGRLARSICEKFPGRAWTVSYATQGQKDVANFDRERRHVSVRQVEGFDATYDMIRMGRNLLPPDAPPEYARHLMARARVIERNDRGELTVRYEAPTGAPDDWAQAEVYDNVALQTFLWQNHVERYADQQWTKLEDHLEFERSALHETPEQRAAVEAGRSTVETDIDYREFAPGAGDYEPTDLT